jgi:gamma-glutamylcyclotransferase (GGCT)/AIG2-like uncharacterized protein YtfP
LGSRQIGEGEFVERKDTAEFVFLYGTLLPQFVPEAMREVVARLHFHGDGSLRGVLYDLGDYPGAVFDTTTDMRVDGTVFELPQDPQVLEALDRYEGYDPTPHAANLFVRKLQRVDLMTGDTIECWVYEYNGNPNGALVIARGRYERPSERP